MSFGLLRTKVVAAHPKRFIKFVIPIFIGFVAIVVGQSTVAPPASAAIYGTIYNVTPKLSGGSSYGEAACAADQVVVGMTMGWNPLGYGFTCKALNSDLSVSAITGKNASYVYCPDGMVAVGMAFINSSGVRAGLLCNTPPGLGSTEVETQYVSLNDSPRAIDKPAGQAYFGGAAMRCNAGDIMVGYRVWSGAWLDGLAPRCAPFTKFTVTYNVNSGGGTAPATQQQSGPNASITLSSAYAGTRAGFTLSGWNTQANGLGTNYAAGATITPTDNLVLYAKWLSSITYDGNSNTGGSVPNTTTAVSSSNVTTLASNSGTLTRTGYTFTGWNTNASGTGTNYAAGLTTYSSTGDITLYAQWNSTITYNGNGATGTVPTAVVSTGSASFALNAGTGLTRTGLSFTGWNTAADGNGTNYAGGASYTSSGSTTLYAIFKPTYTYNANGATGGTAPASTVGPAVGSACATDLGFNNCRIFSYTGSDQTFIIPSDIDATKGIRVEVWGAGGGGSSTYYNDPSGAAGGYSKATLTTPTAGEVLKIVVGQGGLIQDRTVQYGGGGLGGLGGPIGSSGGGYSGIFTGATPLAISGGGGGTSPGSDANGAPSGGGGANQNGGTSGTAGAVGRGGTNSAGGAGATGNATCPTLGSVSHNGSSLLGGASCDEANAEGGGGGGGGYFGGGGGTYQISGGGPINGGGGGGSGYLDATRGTLITASAGENGVIGNFAYADRTSANYASNAGRGGKAYTATVADNSGGNGLITIQWSSPTPGAAVVASNTGNLIRTGYVFAGWNTAADGTGTSVPAGSIFPATTSTTLYAAWTPSNTGLTPNFKANTTTPIGVLASTAYVINTAYAGTDNDLILIDLPDKIQVIASVVSGTLAITTTTNLTLPTGYQSALNTAAASISFVGNLADVNAALATLKYTAAATAVSGNITVTAAYVGLAGTYRYNPATPVNFSSLFPALTRTIAIGALVAPGTPTLDTASDNGSSSTDKITKDNTPTINIGGLTVGATITLTATPSSGTAVTCTFVATTTTGSCTFPTMGDGTYSIVATQTLGGTTTAASTALANVVIDATRPTVTLTSSQIVSGGNRTATQAAPGITNQIIVTFSEAVSGFLISEVSKATSSTGWAITTDALTNAVIAQFTFNVANTTGAGGTPGTLILSILEGVASDVAGNTNTATASNFVINTLIQLTLTNEYDPCCVIGGNNELIAQTTPGGAITLPGQGTLLRTGYTFAGWSLVNTGGNGTVLGATYTPTVPVKLYSSWIPQVYVVTYNANGGNGAPTAASQSYTFGAANLALTTKGTLSRTGYTFSGWNTLATGLGTNYLESASYKPTASIILYAKWTAGTFAVTFTANGGAGTQMTNLSITAGTGIALTANTYTRAGYTFGGWNTLADGTGTAYANSASVTLFGDTTIYAQWVVVKPGAPSVTATSAGNTTATVTVTGAAVSGTTSGPATSYSIQTYANDGTTVIAGKTCTVLATASPLSCQITGLTNGTTYKFIATAINTTGSTAGLISTVTAIPAPFVVTYSLNGGTLTTTTANFNLGSPLTLPLPTRSGYTFAGWYAETGLTTLVGNDGVAYSPSANTTLYAKWSGNTYSITYFGNGSDSGTVTSAATFTFGNSYSIAQKGTMAKSGYTFAGWTTAANGSGTLYANGTDSIASSTATYSAAANLNLYAKWTPQVYVITYNANNASGSPSRATDTFTFGTTPISLPDKTGMTYAGYTFGGWSESANGTAVVNPYLPTQTRTLYALWTGVQYSVSYNVNGGTGSLVDATYTTGTTGITLNNGSTLSRTGYTFGGWKNLAGTTVSGSAYVATDNVTLYAIWTPKTITVTYDKGLASTIPSSFPTSPTSATFGSNFVLGTSSDTATVTAGGNFAFAGWKIDTNTYKPGDSYRISVDAPVVVTAQWIQLFEVTYNSNGGTFATGDGVNDSQCASALCTDGQTIALNLAPTRTGFTFAGWVSQSGTNYAAAASTNVTATNYIFYATWTANNYTITFAAGTGSNGNATAITDSHGSIVQLAASTGYSLTGSVFTGWLIGATTYPAGAFYTLGTDASPITATAQYANNTFKVFYNTNGATVGSTPSATTAVQGASISLNDATGFSRPGFTFEGWSDGTDVRAAGYATTMGTTNSTVIAQWKVALPLTPTISSVTGSDGGATISVAAAGSGGAPAFYLITASPDGATCTVSAPATTCSISPLTNGTSYTFSATATNSTGTSAAATSAAVTPAGKPDAPTGVNALSGNGSATVSFVAPTVTGGPAIASYTVTASPNGATCTVNAPATSCVVPGLANGTAYTFAVTANNGLFTSSASTASSSVVPSTVPDAPTSVTAASTTSGSATITFTAPVNNGGSAVTGYTVTSSPAGATCSIGVNATTYVCTGLTNGTSYTYSVIATNIKGNSTSATSSALTTQGAAAAPTTISAATGDGEATVTFSGAVANGSTITGYTVKAYDSTGNEVSGATCTVTSAATNASCVVTGLTNGSSYTFKAITNSTANSASVTSTLSIATTAITPAKAPDAPSGVQVTAGTGKVTVSWTAPSSNGSPITSYTVTSSPGGFTCTVSAPATTCDVSTGLVAGTNYTFQVTATSVAGTSGASTASASVAINAAPSVPLNVVATSGNASASVSWDPPANTNGSAITGYTATAYTAGNIASGTCTSTAPATTCTVTGLTNGVPYTFKVTATNGIGTSAASTASSAATPSTVPNAPTNAVAAMGDASATVSFITPANNGGSDVLSYTVTSSPGSFTCTVNAPATSCNVTGLSNGTAYTFTVKATNKNGDSAASTASTAGTPVLSSAPILVNPGQPTGNPYVGSPLTSNVTFSGSPTPTVTYQWKVCTDPVDVSTCTDISGATSATYTPTLSDLGKYIVVDATATNRVRVLTETSDPTLVIKPEIAFAAPSPVPGATAGTAYVLSMAAAGGVGTFAYTVRNGALPAGVSLDPATGQISGTPTTAGTYTFTVRVTDSNGVYKDVVITIVVAAAVTQPVVNPQTPTEPQPRIPTCDADCQAAKEAAATKAAADKAAVDAIAKAAADKAAADAAAAAKKASDAAATNASTKAAADAAAAAAAAKAAIDKAAAAAVAQAAADAAAKVAAAQAKAAADAQVAAAKAAADAAAALKNSTATAAAKAAAAASANKSAADAAAAVKAAATAAQQAAQAKTSASNANKQVEIAINSLNSKTATSQASAQANAVAAAAKAAADAAAKAAADAATAAKANATAAQKAASDTAARIATEQKQAADAAALAKIAADAAVKATAEKVAAVAAATKAAQDLATVLAQKATLAEQAAKATDQTARAEIQKKIEEVTTKVEEVQKTVEVATTKADAAVAVQVTAVQTAEAATKEATNQAAEAVAVKAESVVKTAEATKAVAAASVAAKVATAAKEAAAKIPSKAVITTKSSSTASKNSATATVTGLKPGQKVKVTVNVKDK